MHAACPSQYHQCQKLCALPDTELVLLSPASVFPPKSQHRRAGRMAQQIHVFCTGTRGRTD